MKIEDIIFNPIGFGEPLINLKRLLILTLYKIFQVNIILMVDTIKKFIWFEQT